LGGDYKRGNKIAGNLLIPEYPLFCFLEEGNKNRAVAILENLRRLNKAK